MKLDTPGAPPSLNSEYAETNGGGEMILVAVSPESRQAWDEYLFAQWNRWAEKASVARVKPVYQRRPELPFSDDAETDAVGSIVAAKGAIPTQQPQAHVADLPASAPADALSGADTWLGDLQRVEAAIAPDDAPWTAALRSALISNPVSWQTRLAEYRAALAPLTEAIVTATVRVGVSARNAAEARAAHTLSGGFRVLGAPAAIALVGQLEAPGRDGHLESAAALLARFEPELQRVRGATVDAIASGTPA